MASFVENYKIFLAKLSGKYDITGAVGAFNWGSDIGTLSSKLSFDIAKNEFILPEMGDKILLTNQGKLVFQGVITSRNQNNATYGINANDFAWYLNKNKAFHQFRNVSVTDAIKQLCGRYNVPIDNICNMPTMIKNKIYTDQCISDIMLDLIQMYQKETGNHVRMEMISGKFKAFVMTDISINPVFKLAENIGTSQCFDYIGLDYSVSESIEDMVNNVQIIQNNKIILVAGQSESIKKYGMLSETIMVDGTDTAKAKNEAKTIISENGKVNPEMSISIIGDDSIVAGLSVTLPKLGGKWIIKSASHTYNGTHLCSVSLTKVGV